MIIVFLFMLLSLLISQSLMDLMSFIVILVSIWAWKKGQQQNGQRIKFHSVGLERLWIAWFLVFALGLIFAPFSPAEMMAHPDNPWLSRLLVLTELKWIINFYFFIWFFEWVSAWEPNHLMSKQSEKTWSWLWGGLLIFSAYGLLGLIFDFDLTKQQPLSDPGRVGGLFDDPMTFAHVYGLFFILVFFITLQKLHDSVLSGKFKITNDLILLLLTVFFSGLAVFLSMTRGVWIGIFVALLISLFLYRKKYGFIFLSLSSASVLALSLLWPRFQERLFYAFNSDGYDSERLWLWKANWQMFTDHPLLGIGYSLYKWRLRDYFDLLNAPSGQFESHAHNQYLHFLASTGILGLFCFLIFVGFNLFQGWRLIVATKSNSLKGVAFGLFAAQISFLIAALTESNFERAKVRWTYLVFVALTYALLRRLKTTSSLKN